MILDLKLRLVLMIIQLENHSTTQILLDGK